MSEQGILVPGKGLYLPNGDVVQPRTAKERKQVAQVEAYMKGYPTRAELQPILADAVNSGCNNMLHFILSNFELTPKTDEGKRVISVLEQALAEQTAAAMDPHASDCAVHNEPAFVNGPCTCGADPHESTCQSVQGLCSCGADHNGQHQG